MNLMPILFYYIFQVIAKWKCDIIVSKTCRKKKVSIVKVGPHFSVQRSVLPGHSKKLSINFSVYFKLNEIRQSTFFVDYQNGSETYKQYQVLVQ